MAGEYGEIEKVETVISEWLKGRFLKERRLFSEMADLILEAFKPLGALRREPDESDFALLTLASRIFNDCEGAKHLLLWGLPDQAQPVIRDIIECTLLFRLFLREPKKAKKWLISLGEYQAGVVNAKLSESGIKAIEYSFYGMLSHQSHANFLATLSHVQEVEVEDGMLRTAHFGSARNPETEYFIQQNFLILFFLMYAALEEPLTELYYQHSETSEFERWHSKVKELPTKLEDLTSEISQKHVLGKSQVDQSIQELVYKRMRMDIFKSRVARDGNLS